VLLTKFGETIISEHGVQALEFVSLRGVLPNLRQGVLILRWSRLSSRRGRGRTRPLTATAQKTTENNKANAATCSASAKLKNKSAKLEKALLPLLPPVVSGYRATADTRSGMPTADCTRLIVAYCQSLHREYSIYRYVLLEY
jgi:hypothetical protein